MLNISNEVWKSVRGFENLYQVSNLGRVANFRGQLMSPQVINSGYHAVVFKVNKVTHNRLVHRLVAEAFLENLQGKTEVNHLDGCKLNNVVSNLQWVTSAENKAHAKAAGLWEYNKPTTGIKLGRGSKYFNVSWDSSRKKWKTAVMHNGRTLGQRRFDSEEEAALHVNAVLDYYGIADRPRNVITD